MTNSQSRHIPEKSNPKLDQACLYVSDSWFPVNGELFKKVKSGLESGFYDDNFNDLIVDIKSDFSLFFYCIKELSRLVKTEKTKAILKPSDFLKDSGMDNLKKVLNVGEQKISNHRFSNINMLHAQRLTCALTSACFSEGLAEAVNIDPDTAFTTALFRQLGLTLVAWNYPAIYRTIASASISETELESGLSQMLGYSPSLLAISLARQWGIATPLTAAISDEVQAETASEQEISEGLKKICKIGETLARISVREDYPEKASEWSKARNDVLRYVGSHGLQSILGRLQNVCQYLNKSAPDLFKADQLQNFGPAPEAHILINNNLYLDKLPQELSSKIRILYKSFTPGSISKNSIDMLVNEIIPAAGFKGGCIYLIDPSNRSLVPRLAIGSSHLSHFKAVNYMEKNGNTDPIVNSFWSKTPTAINIQAPSGMEVNYIAATIGESQRGGVLFLFPGNELMSKGGSYSLQVFMAINQTLADCLTLN